MLPWPLLAALVIAFGLGDRSAETPIDPVVVWQRAWYWVAGFALYACLAWLISAIAVRQLRKIGPWNRMRRLTLWTGRILEVLALILFAWSSLSLEWPRIVDDSFAGRRSVLLHNFLTLAPFILELLVLWSAEFRVERLLKGSETDFVYFRFMNLRLRQTLGLVLPMILVYGLGGDLLRQVIPEYRESSGAQIGMLAAMAGLILLVSPVFVRISCPTRRLEAGPLRDRLERLAKRSGFPCRDILVWDTGGTLVNAGITGAVPFFRYVLLTDSLIERLDVNEIEAVFGHEIGHVKHRHLIFFGLFFVGSVGLLSLLDFGMQRLMEFLPPSELVWMDTSLEEIVEWGIALLILISYFFYVFGWLSRWSERQADIFGCQAVSCSGQDCPPHFFDEAYQPASASAAWPDSACAGGIQIFARALSNVAMLNGISLQAPSWRHGSIGQRIKFLESIEFEPEVLPRFERRISRLRLTLLMLLAVGTVVSVFLHEGALPGN